MATKYVHFTEDQKERARLTDLADLLCRQGHTLKRSGSEYEWKNGGAKITIRGNLWYHQYEQTGGDAIDFVRRFYGMDYPEALEYLLGNNCGTLRVAPPIEKGPRKPFVLPQENENMRRVYAYLLRRRGIDHDVLNTFVYKGMIYESADYHNAVFVGFDPEGILFFADIKDDRVLGGSDGTMWKSDCVQLRLSPTGSFSGGGVVNSSACRTARPFSISRSTALPVFPFRNPALTVSPIPVRRTVRMCSARSPVTVKRRSGERSSGWSRSRFTNYHISPVSACLRRMSRLTFPERVFGSVLTNSISRGYL